MTRNATHFVSPTTFQAISQHPVALELFQQGEGQVIEHISLAQSSDLVVVAPATANLVAKLAHGIADDLLSTTLLAVACPVMVAPAMNPTMYAQPAVQANLSVLRSRGVIVVEPGTGLTACGDVGRGRLPEPQELQERIEEVLSRGKDLEGIRLLVTAGPTQESFDAVRFISNPSTGKMGYAVAEAAAARGARVTLVSGPTNLAPPAGVETVGVRTAEEMLTACVSAMPETDWVVAAAAVSDYRPQTTSPGKLKKGEGDLTVTLVRTPDVLAEIGLLRRADQVLCGFAAETDDLLRNARGKLEAKHLDLIVANDLTGQGAGFGVDTNRVTLLPRDGSPQELPLLPKREVATRILDRMRDLSR
jgi:phosphopantothenoylcysteine decarboxylase/phosphopantothenate--cysteine ligase